MLEEMLKNVGAKLLSENDMSGLNVLRQKYKNQRIVLTNGGFSVIHAGHLRYLIEARSFGDILVVAVNTNESIKKIKGYDAPVPEHERYFHLCCIKCVDYVIPFSESPIPYFAALMPDLYVKGGDYTLETINQVERQELKTLEIPIKFTSYHPGQSASAFVKQCRTVQFKEEK
jgi:rfaE bifunctional protein nucleotidyltransferase chain/domain